MLLDPRALALPCRVSSMDPGMMPSDFFHNYCQLLRFTVITAQV